MTTETDQKGLTITRHLPVPLDQYRKNALGTELAAQRMEEMRLTDHMKNVTESLKALIKDTQKNQNIAARTIHQGFEMKEVPCRQVIHLETNTVRIYREDTGEEIETRALDANERAQLLKKAKSPLPPLTPSSPPPPTKEVPREPEL